MNEQALDVMLKQLDPLSKWSKFKVQPLEGGYEILHAFHLIAGRLSFSRGEPITPEFMRARLIVTYSLMRDAIEAKIKDLVEHGQEIPQRKP